MTTATRPTIADLIGEAGTQREVAGCAGLSPMALSAYVRGLNTPSLASARALAEALSEVGDRHLSTADVLIASWRGVLAKERGVVSNSLLGGHDHGRSDVTAAVDALWAIANTVGVSETFRAEVMALGERLIDLVEDEVR